MSEAPDTATDGGDDTYEADLQAALDADEGGEQLEAPAEGAEPEAKADEGEKKPPLPPEEIEKRWRQTQASRNAERTKRQAAEQRASELETRLADLESKVTPQQAAERPDPTEDPIGYMEWLSARLDAEEQVKAQEQQQTQAQQQRAEAVKQVIGKAQEYETDFRELNPDYDKAADHLYAAKKAEYLDGGYDDAEAHSMVMAEFLTRADRAMKAGKDPAEIVYNLAKRTGYANEGPPKAQTDAEAKLRRIAEGQKAASPLANAGGRGGDDLDMDSISQLDGAAFDKAFDKMMAKAARAGH